MGFIEYYLIFAFTTAIFALIDIFMPVMKEAISNGASNVLTENPKLSYFVYICISAIIAPLIIAPLLVPSMNERFRSSLSDMVHEQEEI